MTCQICKSGETKPGHANVMMERGDSFVVVKHVPAQICGVCGEYYLSEEVGAAVLRLAEEAIQSGAEVEVVRFAA